MQGSGSNITAVFSRNFTIVPNISVGPEFLPLKVIFPIPFDIATLEI
jgi:hypothetical protein